MSSPSPHSSDPIPSPDADEAGTTVDLAPLEPAEEAAPGGAPPRRRSRAVLAGIAAGLVVLVGGTLLVVRAQHRRRALAEGMTRAEALVRLDTAASHRAAAALLAPLAKQDPVNAGSLRAFALAMLFLDDRDAAAATEAERLLLAPDRADTVPPWAELATAALALGRREAGTAITAASHVPGAAWADVLQARTALVAGSLEAAADSAAAAAAEDPALPAARALEGDLARRARHDPRRARAAYAAALAASPTHPRATFGLAKLALSGEAPAADARAALQRLLDDRAGTPGPERARAALHLAALRLRAGDEAGAARALDAAALDARARAWADRAARLEADAPRYRAVPGAPGALVSASDEDPAEAAAAVLPAAPDGAGASRSGPARPPARTRR